MCLWSRKGGEVCLNVLQGADLRECGYFVGDLDNDILADPKNPGRRS